MPLIRALLGSGRARAAPAALAFLFLGLGIWQFGSGFYIAAKGEIAQVLLERAWTKTLETGENQKPWSWADTWPVAKLEFPRIGKEAIVLDKVSGQALAFGPGLIPGLPGIGEVGTAVIAAHNDTHFAFLGDLKPGDVIRVATRTGSDFTFQVLAFDIVDIRKPLTLRTVDEPHLVLSTCYPFRSFSSHTPYRYLVTARLNPN